MNYYKNHKGAKRKFQTAGVLPITGSTGVSPLTYGPGPGEEGFTTPVSTITGSTSRSGLTYGPKPVGGPDAETRLAYMHPEKRRMELVRIQKNLASGQTIPQADKDLLNAAYRQNNPNPNSQMTDDPELLKKIFPGGDPISNINPGQTGPPQTVVNPDGTVAPKTPVTPVDTVVAPATSTVTNEELLDALDAKLAGAKDKASIEALQAQLKVPVDGKWGPVSQAAFNKQRRVINLGTKAGKETDEKIRRIQRRLGVGVDGIWGTKTDTAFKKLKALQGDLGVTADGVWGPNTKKAAIARSTKTADEIQSLATNGLPKQDLQRSSRPTNTLSNGDARKKARGMRKEARQEKRSGRKLDRQLRRDADKFNADGSPKLRRGGLFYNSVEK